MNVIQFIMGNWDFILLIVLAALALIWAIFKGNKSVVMKMLVSLVTEAEKNFGSGTGTLKLASVVAAIYPKLPAIIKTFITDAMISKWVEEALIIAKEKWKTNSNIKAYIEPPNTVIENDTIYNEEPPNEKLTE